MRYFAYLRLFYTIFNKKHLPNLAWIESQGLLFVKIAQTFALRIDFLSPEKTYHLQKLYTQATPVSYKKDELLDQLSDALKEDLLSIDETPIGVASVGQVYKGILKDHTKVAIKLIKKDVKQAFIREVKSFRRFAKMMIFFYPKLEKVADPVGIIDHIETYTLQELNLLNEIKHTKILNDIKSKYEHHFDFTTLHFPTYVTRHCTEDRLVSHFVDGMPVSEALKLKVLPQDKMLDIFRWHGFYMFIVGTFHGDIHPGNIMVSDIGYTLIDTGALSHVSTRIQQGLFEFMKALSQYDYPLCAEKLNHMAVVGITGKKYEKFLQDFLTLYEDFAHQSVSKKSLTKQMMHTIKLGVHAGMTFESGMFPIIKSLMYLDGIVLMGAPDMELMKEMRTFIHTFEEAKQHA